MYFKGNTEMLVTTLRNFDAAYRLAKNDLYNSIIADLQQGGQTPPLQIHPAIFNAYADNLRKAVTGVMGTDARYFETSQRLQLNVTKFAAAKAYAVTQELVGARSARPDASPADFAKDAKRILNTYNRYQAAEYAAAVARARTARQWANFNNPNDIANELYPNIRWIPSRSVEPRPLHRKFWNQVWAKDDPFWNDNQPGNLWGCKCDWERTDSSPTNLQLEPIKAEPGLKGNPGKTGEVFSADASYFQKVGKIDGAQQAINKVVKRWISSEVDIWKDKNVPEKIGFSVDGKNFQSGSMTITRGSVRGIWGHTNNEYVRMSIVDIDKKVGQYKYVGWKERDPNKHKEADYFLYYEVQINGERFYANVMANKDLDKEVLYCYTKNVEGIHKGTPPNFEKYKKK